MKAVDVLLPWTPKINRFVHISWKSGMFNLWEKKLKIKKSKKKMERKFDTFKVIR